MKNKINYNSPQFPKRLPGTIWGITTFFNPAGYKNKKENYIKFRESIKKQGLNLVTVELEFDDHPFEIKSIDTDILVQIRGNKENIMWQKERLLNIGFKNLPKDCDKIVWLDCDIIFQNNNWVKETSDLLEKYVVVQPFETVLRLGNDNNFRSDIEKLEFGLKENNKVNSFSFYLNNKDYYIKKFGTDYPGDVGFAWAARKEIFSDIGFYDTFIQGSSDYFMAFSFCNLDEFSEKYASCPNFVKHQKDWSNHIYEKVKGSIYYTSGLIFHLWHGSYHNRFYRERQKLLKEYNFNPYEDIALDLNGCWKWGSSKEDLHNYFKMHFNSRNESGLLLKDIIYFVKNKNKRNYYINYIIGKIGIIIKKISPNLYLYFKKLLKK